MTRLVQAGALAGVLLTSVSAPHAAPHQSVARAVTTHIVVTEGDGVSPVVSLTRDMLTVRTNGIVVPVVDLRPADPLSVVLLIDVTSSVSESMSSFIWDGQGSLDDVNPSGYKPPDSPGALFQLPILRGVVRGIGAADRVRVGRITRTPELGPDFTSDRRALERTVEWALDVAAEERYAETPIWDGVDMAVTALETETTRRRAIVLVTDGLSTGNRLSFQAVLDRAIDADVSVFVVGQAWRMRSGRGYAMRPPWILMSGAFERTPWALLRRLAAGTGGVFVPDGDQGWPEPERRLRAVMSLLRASHAVTFQSPLLPGESGVLTVDVAGAGLQVHMPHRHRAPAP